MSIIQTTPQKLDSIMEVSCLWNKAEILALAISYGGDINQGSQHQGSLLDLCIINGSIQCTELLLHHGANIHYRPMMFCPDHQRLSWQIPNWYHLRVNGSAEQHHCIKLLLQHQDKLAKICLFDATLQNDFLWLDKLLAFGLNANQTDFMGNTPLHIASYLGFEQCITILLLHRAQPHLLNELMQTPQELAMQNQHHTCLNLLQIEAANASKH